MPKAANADDDHRRVRRQLRQHSLYGAIWRKAGIGERRCDHRIQVTDRYETPRIVYQQVLGQPTVEAETDARRALHTVDAEVLGAGRTGFASAAAVQAVDRDRQAFLDTAHTRTDFIDPAGVLVAHHERWPPRR